MKKAALVIFLVLFADQFLKIWIKTHFLLGEEVNVIGNWFILHFTENNGMAFGYEFGVSYGKLFLSVFRIIAIGAIGWYLFKIIKQKESNLLIISLALIVAGAIGNVIDSAFYGLLFSESTFYQQATFLPVNGGYSSFLHGKVVDMFYFPLFEGHWPSWFPFWGDQSFLFFSPVFNLADSSISVGVALLILFQKNLFTKKD
ncbi:MAG: lipoprotein signal peptidase [Bacteroidales bacterium]|nr:lipoprotein signal peptidase [Bacteroidales bacterium]